MPVTTGVRSSVPGASCLAASRSRVTGVFQLSKSNSPGFFLLSARAVSAPSAAAPTTTTTPAAARIAPSRADPTHPRRSVADGRGLQRGLAVLDVNGEPHGLATVLHHQRRLVVAQLLQELVHGQADGRFPALAL